MQKHFHGVLIGISVLPALLVMPAMSDVMTSRVRITDGSTVNFNGVTADSINSIGEYGGVIDVSLGRANITGSTFSNNLAHVGGVITGSPCRSRARASAACSTTPHTLT